MDGMSPQRMIEWNPTRTSVELWSDGVYVATGNGHDDVSALTVLWSTLDDRKEVEHAAAVARSFHALTGRDPERPRS
jgi:hypothetical protein